MYTKSLIQQHREMYSIKESFNDGISNIMEKYNIEDSIFVLLNGFVKELTKGYFVVEKEFDNINEAIRECNINTMGVRVLNNSNFQIGTIYNTISQCPKDSKILDIESLENVE